MLMLAHELQGLLEGSLEYIKLARHNLTDAPPDANIAGSMATRLSAAQDALERMNELLERGMQPSIDHTSMLFQPMREPLIEALVHAADALRPIADDRDIRITVDCSPRLVLSPAGPIYTIIVNAIRNSIEAIGRDGAIDIVAELETSEAHEAMIALDVYDNGPGPRRGIGERVFELGYTTKVNGLGVGLALCSEIVLDLHGTISLTRNGVGANGDARGAHLAVRMPASSLTP